MCEQINFRQQTHSQEVFTRPRIHDSYMAVVRCQRLARAAVGSAPAGAKLTARFKNSSRGRNSAGAVTPSAGINFPNGVEWREIRANGRQNAHRSPLLAD